MRFFVTRIEAGDGFFPVDIRLGFFRFLSFVFLEFLNRWDLGFCVCVRDSSVFVESVNRCKLPKGEGSGVRYECSVLSCAWKAPRALTGSLASTAHCSSHHHDGPARGRRSWRRSSLSQGFPVSSWALENLGDKTLIYLREYVLILISL